MVRVLKTGSKPRVSKAWGIGWRGESEMQGMLGSLSFWCAVMIQGDPYAGKVEKAPEALVHTLLGFRGPHWR